MYARIRWAFALVTLALGACGGADQTTYELSGNISGLAGAGLMLSDGNGHELTVPSGATSFTFPTPAAAGTAYNISVTQQPGGSPKQACSIENPSGTLTSNSSSAAVHCVGPFVYVSTVNGVSGFVMNASTGALTQMAGSPFQAGAGVPSLLVHPSLHFAYGPNPVSGGIYAWEISSGSGVLEPIAGSPFDTSADPYNLTIDSTGRFLYAVGYGTGVITAYTIDPTTGALTQIAGSPYPVETCPPCYTLVSTLTIDPSGKYAYLANYESYPGSTILGYAIDGTTGALQPLSGSPYPVPGMSASRLVIDPSGKFLFTVGDTGADVFTIDGSTGVLSLVPGSPFPAGAFPAGDSLSIHPNGKFLYLFCPSGPSRFSTHYQVIVDSIDPSSGVLTPVPGSPFAYDGGAPVAFNFSADEKFAYSYTGNTYSQDLDGFSIDPDTGAIVLVATYNGGWASALDPSKKFLYVSSNVLSGAGTIVAYAIDPDTHALTPIAHSF